jgi:hypothetical protein
LNRKQGAIAGHPALEDLKKLVKTVNRSKDNWNAVGGIQLVILQVSVCRDLPKDQSNQPQMFAFRSWNVTTALRLLGAKRTKGPEFDSGFYSSGGNDGGEESRLCRHVAQ